tara:strand:+ start:149 stop:292 length:144 start_codon:yes stop_codon:yes gene_type:complete
MPIQIGRPVRPQPIQRIGNYGLDRRINDVARLPEQNLRAMPFQRTAF